MKLFVKLYSQGAVIKEYIKHSLILFTKMNKCEVLFLT